MFLNYVYNIRMKKLSLLSLAFAPCFLLAQENYFSHTVSKGETLYQISRKYNVRIGEINQLNPNINTELIYPDQIIRIPNQTTTPLTSNEQDADYTYYTVEVGETKFGLQRKYGVSIADLEKDNPQIVNMLKAGERIRIRKSKNTVVESVASTSRQRNESSHQVVAGETLYAISRRYAITLNQLVEANQGKLGEFLQIGQILSIPEDAEVATISSDNKHTHIVERGETKYGLSKKFNTTIAELEQLNPHIQRMLRAGDQIIIPGQKNIAPESLANLEPVQIEEVVEQTEDVTVISANNYSDYIIQPKETLYSLSRKAQLSQEELVALNPVLDTGVQAGMIIKMPDFVEQKTEETNQQHIEQIEEKQTEESVAVSSDQSMAQFADLSKTIQTGQSNKVMFLLPFTSADFQNYQNTGLAKESEDFMQFYSGALVAVDSIKKLGIGITAEFVNATIDINSIKRQFSIHKPDIIIGAYHLNQVIADNSAPFIYPFTDDFEVNSTSFYRAVPSIQTKAKKLLEYINSKNGNLIVISDIEKAADKELIAQVSPEAKFAHLTDKTSPDIDNLKALLDKNKKNFILLNTDRTSLFLNLTNILLNEATDYDLQLAVVQEVPKEIAPIRLRLLKTLYIATTDQNINNTTFHKKYLKETNKQSTQESIRGFDVTYDILLRMTQNEDFEQTIEKYKTKQIELEFDYTKDSKGNFNNTAVHILHYATDSDTKKTN
jgi:LysM repeat protein